MELRKILVQFLEVALKPGIFVEFPLTLADNSEQRNWMWRLQINKLSYTGTPWKLGDLVKLSISANVDFESILIS